jgi:hypothetical protein
MKTPYIGFSNETLSKLPRAKTGDTFTCKRCGEIHDLRACDDGSTIILWYKCREDTMLGAVDGRWTIDVPCDHHGEVEL